MKGERKERKRLERERGKIESTNSFKKVVAYLERLTSEVSFQKRVLEIRKICGLPAEGLKNYLYINYKGKKLVRYPESLDTDEKAIETITEFTEEIGLYFDWSDLVQHYIVYNNFELKNWWAQPIYIEDMHSNFYGPFQYKEEKEWFLKYQMDMAKTHPVAIFIDPYTPERDIVDYVKKLYNLSIKPIQDRYKNPKVKLGKIRKRSQVGKLRNSFIYENRNLPKKELVSLVAEKFGPILEYTYLAKIIKDEERIRKLSVHK